MSLTLFHVTQGRQTMNQPVCKNLIFLQLLHILLSSHSILIILFFDAFGTYQDFNCMHLDGCFSFKNLFLQNDLNCDFNFIVKCAVDFKF